MNKAVLLFLVAMLLGCAAPVKPVKADLREIPGQYYQEKIWVEGPYSRDDVDRMIALVANDEKKVLSIKPPADVADKYRNREIQELPADAAEVRTGYIEAPGEGWGITYKLKKRDNQWQIVDSNPWMS